MIIHVLRIMNCRPAHFFAPSACLYWLHRIDRCHQPKGIAMTQSATMQAAVLENFAAPLALRTVDRPVAGSGQVLVRVMASGVNPLDVKVHAGQGGHARVRLGDILGIDMAGVVEAVGAGVDGFKPGDEVYGMTGGIGGVQGSLAQYAAVDADLLAIKPRNISMREAAALPLVFITAWEGLVERARVAAGDQVLVHGGAGGVGHVAVQIARAFGADVYATGSAASQDAIGGHVVSCLGWGSHALAPLSFRAATYSGVFTLLPLLSGKGRARHGAIMREASKLVEAGKLTIQLDARRFTLATADAAHQLIADGAAKGKLVVEIE